MDSQSKPSAGDEACQLERRYLALTLVFSDDEKTKKQVESERIRLLHQIIGLQRVQLREILAASSPR